MSSKFVSILDHVGDALKKFFTSPVAADIELGGISVAEIAFPQFQPLLAGVGAAIAKAQALAQAANVSGDTTAQVTALVLSDAQSVFDDYEQQTGQTIESAQQQAIIAGLLKILQNLPAPAAAVKPVTASAGTVSALAEAENPGLHAISPA